MNNRNLFTLAVAVVESVTGINFWHNEKEPYSFNIFSNFTSLKVGFQNLSKKEVVRTQNKTFNSVPKNKNFNVRSHNRTANEIREL